MHTQVREGTPSPGGRAGSSRDFILEEEVTIGITPSSQKNKNKRCPQPQEQAPPQRASDYWLKLSASVRVGVAFWTGWAGRTCVGGSKGSASIQVIHGQQGPGPGRRDGLAGVWSPLLPSWRHPMSSLLPNLSWAPGSGKMTPPRPWPNPRQPADATPGQVPGAPPTSVHPKQPPPNPAGLSVGPAPH